MSRNDDILINRRLNLKSLVVKSGLSASEFGKTHLEIKNNSEMSLYLSGKRDVSDSKANDFEALLGLPHGSLDKSDVSDYLDTPTTVIHVPFYTLKLSAGVGCEILSDETSGSSPFSIAELDKSIKYSDLIAMKVKGDSMSPTLNDGATVIIDTSQKEIIDNRIYAYYSDDCLAKVKRLRKNFGNITIISDNKEIPEITLTPDNTHGLVIIGRVISSQNKH